jgi:hypothetical protein
VEAPGDTRARAVEQRPGVALNIGSRSSDNVTCLAVRDHHAVVVSRFQLIHPVAQRLLSARADDSNTVTGGDVAIHDAPPLPTSKEQCNNGGWRAYGIFKNQGECVSFGMLGGRCRRRTWR